MKNINIFINKENVICKQLNMYLNIPIVFDDKPLGVITNSTMNTNHDIILKGVLWLNNNISTKFSSVEYMINENKNIFSKYIPSVIILIEED